MSASEILLTCRVCPAQRLVPRVSYDYPEAVRIDSYCDKHHPGDRIEEFYYDAAGKHITRDPFAPSESAP